MAKGIGKDHLSQIEITEKKIFETLKKHGKLIWTDFVEKSNLSESTLHKYLKRLVKIGEIRKWIDPNSGYPPNVFYELTKDGKGTLRRYEYLIKHGKVILELPADIIPADIKIIETGATKKTRDNWITFPGNLYRGFLKEPDKYRGMIVPLKFFKDLDTEELDEIILYAVLPRKEFQDTYNKIQETFKTEAAKQKAARKMFRSGLKAIKEAFENLLQEWKEEYPLD